MLKVCSVFVCPCTTVQVHAAAPRSACLGSWQLQFYMQHSCPADASTAMNLSTTALFPVACCCFLVCITVSTKRCPCSGHVRLSPFSGRTRFAEMVAGQLTLLGSIK